MEIRNSNLYVPFYDHAIADKVRKEMEKRLFIEIYLKGGRFSGKSYYVVNQMIELAYRDPSRSSIVIAMTLTDHQERGVILFDKVLTDLGLRGEWTWKTKKTRPVLVRNVNGYKQEIRFLSLTDLETAGFEGPINESTGKQGYYGTLWADEMAKKTDNSPDADFAYINRLRDAVMTAKNTFIRHMTNNNESQTLFTFYTLNPWGEGNPIIEEFHKVLNDDIDKLREVGYNLGYNDDQETLQIMATTNFRVNSKLGDKALASVRAMRKDPRAMTMIDGATGLVMNSSFGRELTLMRALNKGKNIPHDTEFVPMNLSMDVGTASASVLYVNGYDLRYMVRSGGNYYPTRIITKGEYVSDPQKDIRSIPERYKELLKHIQRQTIRWPEMKKGITLYIDGSALDTIELLKAFIQELKHEEPGIYDLDEWLQVVPQKDKWKTSERREHRRDRFSEMVYSYALLIDINECPEFYNMTSKIISNASEKKYDHCYDALMYGVMPLYPQLITGLKLKGLQGKQTIIEKEED